MRSLAHHSSPQSFCDENCLFFLPRLKSTCFLLFRSFFFFNFVSSFFCVFFFSFFWARPIFSCQCVALMGFVALVVVISFARVAYIYESSVFCRQLQRFCVRVHVVDVSVPIFWLANLNIPNGKHSSRSAWCAYTHAQSKRHKITNAQRQRRRRQKNSMATNGRKKKLFHSPRAKRRPTNDARRKWSGWEEPANGKRQAERESRERAKRDWQKSEKRFLAEKYIEIMCMSGCHLVRSPSNTFRYRRVIFSPMCRNKNHFVLSSELDFSVFLLLLLLCARLFFRWRDFSVLRELLLHTSTQKRAHTPTMARIISCLNIFIIFKRQTKSPDDIIVHVAY